MVTLNPRDGRPIYTQIKEQFTKLILSGVLTPGEKLPSVRALASQLSINPNTIQRAYAELETEGYCISRAGKGSFVAPKAEWNPAHLQTAKETFLAAANALRALGVSEQELQNLLFGQGK